jgi:SAM-dependent methyltransferase
VTPQEFPSCPICGSETWRLVYRGPVRDGVYGKTRSGDVARCGGCGVDRLAESLCFGQDDYAGDAYRVQLGQSHDLDEHRRTHDELARFTVETVWPMPLRGKIVADVGCGGGSLLDHISGLVKTAIAIDPAAGFAASLLDRGYDYFTTAAAAAVRYEGAVDLAFAIQVIEHVDDPKAFLADILKLVKPGGLCVVSTPNRNDILLDLLPDNFPAFFYRTQHRWAFDASTLGACAVAAGFDVREVRHVHRYGMANALLWLRDRKPGGREQLAVIDREADTLWRAWLESTGRADNLYMLLTRP